MNFVKFQGIINIRKMEQISSWVWSERFWLPEGFTWKDFEPTPGVNKPNFNDLYYVPLLAVLLVCIRYLFERYTDFLHFMFCFFPAGIRV